MALLKTSSFPSFSVPMHDEPSSRLSFNFSRQSCFLSHTGNRFVCNRRPDFSLCHTLNAALEPATVDPGVQVSLKRAVAKRVVELIKPGMIVGLGTGSTASLAIEEMGKLIQKGKLKDVIGVGVSYQSKVLARQFGLKTADLNDVNTIDLAFDGADEVDSAMNLMKGGGAAHTMAKVVNTMAKRCVIIVDQSKIVSELGQTFPVAVIIGFLLLQPREELRHSCCISQTIRRISVDQTSNDKNWQNFSFSHQCIPSQRSQVHY